MQRLLLDGLVKLDRQWGHEPFPLYLILSKAMPQPRPAPGAAKPHKLRRRPADIGDQDNPSRAMAGLCARGLVQRGPGGGFLLTAAGAAQSMPATVWAVRRNRAGLEWREAQVVRTTATRATLLLGDLKAVVSLTKLFGPGAQSSGWIFTDQRHGVVEKMLGMMGRFTPAAGMRPAEAALVLGLPLDRDRHDLDAIQAAYRRAVKAAHPDVGGSADAFDEVTTAREVLLSVLDD